MKDDRGKGGWKERKEEKRGGERAKKRMGEGVRKKHQEQAGQ